MKKLSLLATALSAVALSNVAGAAVATSDGKITFNGKIVDNTCVVTNATKNLTVKLPTVSKNSLATFGSVAGKTAFRIGLEGCTTGNSAQNGSKVRLFFTPANEASYNQGNKVLTNTFVSTGGNTAATGVGIQILSQSGKPIPIGQNIDAYTTDIGDQKTLGPTVLFDYFAQYFVLENSVGAGDVQAKVEYTIAYE